jgi:TatD DNase family protein
MADETGGTGPENVAAAVELAARVNVDRIVQVGVDVPSSRFSVGIAEEYPSVVATVALHPNEAPRLAAQGGDALSMAIREIEALAEHPRVRGIGETGLDYFRTDESGRGPQHECFRAHVELAKKSGKALVIHDRDAHSDVIKALDDIGAPDIVVMHCFSGDVEFARECRRRGFFLSFAGNVTFKNAAALREALISTPSERLLVETDAPFLTPAPYRGRPNASYLIPITVRAIAEIRDVSVEALCEALSTNIHTVFGSWSQAEASSDA